MPKTALDRIEGTRLQMGGYVGEYIAGINERWLKVAPDSNPAMLDMFRDRDRLPLREMVPWAGEFAGKYLTGAVQVYRTTGDPGLYAYIEDFVGDLVGCQAEDGYLGPWPKDYRLANRAPNNNPEGGMTWDTWGHYHIMLGLMLWHEESGSTMALNCARRIGDLICEIYLGQAKPRLVDTGSSEMNLAIVHSLALLYQKTWEDRYLDMARQIVDEFGAMGLDGQHLAGDYLHTAINGIEFYRTPKPRWESLHPIMGLVELFYITGEEDYRRAFEHIWRSIGRLDRHNNGGFSSGEQAQGNPYHQGAIETCCTIAWSALSVEMLRLTGDPLVADELELSTINSIVGMHSPTGRWVTYDTPMDGVRKASHHSIVFQAREGSPELNCCSVNGARGFGLIGEWAIMGHEEGPVVNWYGPCTMKVMVEGCGVVEITQETDYPRTGDVSIGILPSKSSEFTLGLRIPRWSKETYVGVGGEDLDTAEPGTYLKLERKWNRGDSIEVGLDMSTHAWIGERECVGKASLFRGPILLTYDYRYNDVGPDEIPPLDATKLNGSFSDWQGRIPPFMLTDHYSTDGRKVRLCDFGSAGIGGSRYRSWLPVENLEDAPSYWNSA